MTEQPEVLIDPERFQDGRERALLALLGFLADLPETLATRTRDEGRGASHAVALVRPVVERLLADPTHPGFTDQDPGA